MNVIGELGFDQDAETLPHMERGGDGGGLMFFGSHSGDRLPYDILDDHLDVVINVTRKSLVDDWKANT